MSVLTRIAACGLILCCASACVTSQPAPTTRPAAGLEPGEAEARQRTTSATMPTTFSSPAVEVRGVWLASRDMVLPRDICPHRKTRFRVVDTRLNCKGISSAGC